MKSFQEKLERELTTLKRYMEDHQIQLPIPSPAPCDLCPICGEHIYIDGRSTHGKLIGSCGDAFSQESWESDPNEDLNPSLIEICF